LHLGYHGNGHHFFYFFNPQKLPHTTVDIPTKFQEVWWKESKICLNPPFFCYHGNCGKVCPTDSDLFVLSRSTRWGCCSYQVSSISVWRITRYDHFCVFQFFSILAVSMATAAILKKSTLKSTTSHGIWYSCKVSSRHLREIERSKMCGRIIIVKKKCRIAIRHPTRVGVT
jgi:hypothetical protein